MTASRFAMVSYSKLSKQKKLLEATPVWKIDTDFQITRQKVTVLKLSITLEYSPYVLTTVQKFAIAFPAVSEDSQAQKYCRRKQFSFYFKLQSRYIKL